jgi:hypothetical protein
MQFPGRKLPFVAERGALDTWEVIRVARCPASKGLSFNDVTELLKGKYPSNRFLVEDGQTLLLVRSPSFGDPLDYPLGLLTYKEMLTFIFIRWSSASVLVGACSPTLIGAVNFDEEMF